MKKGLIISDAGPIFSLALVDKLAILESLFERVFIPKAVWEEITRDETKPFHQVTFNFFKDKVKEITGRNDLTFIMDYGESEAVKLYNEMAADFLLIDDKKARLLAENLGVQCVGTIGILSIAKERGLVSELRPLFHMFLNNKRYYSIRILDEILTKHGEERLETRHNNG